MVRTIRVSWPGLFVARGTAGKALAGPDEGPFRNLSLDQARQATTPGGKRFVLVEVYTVWCGPCKKLDETTRKHQEVRDWLSREAVCLNAFPSIPRQWHLRDLRERYGYAEAARFAPFADARLVGTEQEIRFSRTFDDQASARRPAQALKHTPITRR